MKRLLLLPAALLGIGLAALRPWAFLLFAFAFLFFCLNVEAQSEGCDGAGNCYVRAGATGSGTGADWNNAYTGLGAGTGQINPSSITRGVTYYFAAGNYSAGSATSLTTADSGTTTITLQAATVASHGTATGWNNSYVGQAVLPPLYIESDYWVINGAYRGSGSGYPATDWRTGYGFKVYNNNGSNVPISTAAGLWVGPNTFPTSNNTVIEYVEVAGSGDTTGTYQDQAIEADQCENCVIQYNYLHDIGGTGLQIVAEAAGTDNAVVEYNWLQNNQSTPAEHGEGIGIKASATGGNWNLTFAYNYLENMEGTGYIGTPDCSGCTGAWYFYGNVFFANTSEWHGNTSPQNGLSYAYIQYFGASGAGNQLNMTTIAFYNNTIYQLAAGMSQPDCDAVNGGFATVTNFYFQNNLVVNCRSAVVSAPTSGTLTQDHNSYFSVTNVSDTGTGVQNVSGVIPFTSPSTNDLSLSQDTAIWSSMNAPYNIDIIGATRTSSRGAFQYVHPQGFSLTGGLLTGGSSN